jgi:uncharacterized protein YcbX
MYVKELWRYPVKSMAGERLQTARVSTNGIEGDRIIQVRTPIGRFATSRTFPGLLGLHGTLGPDGEPLIDGKPWNDPGVLAAVRKIVDPAASIVRDGGRRRFDVLPLLVATDGSIAEFGRDGRRLRPNIILGGVPGLEEREWEGGELQIGSVVIAIRDLRGRCIMTTFDPDTLAQDRQVLQDIVDRFDGKLALNCDAVRGGEIHVGQDVTVVAAGALA